MLRALADAPGGLTTPQLARFMSSSASWINALGTARMLLIKQERLGRVRRSGSVAGEKTRPSALWSITPEGIRHLESISRRSA